MNLANKVRQAGVAARAAGDFPRTSNSTPPGNGIANGAECEPLLHKMPWSWNREPPNSCAE